jgi:hypothetical protein
MALMCRNGQPEYSLRRIASQWFKPRLFLIVAGDLSSGIRVIFYVRRLRSALQTPVYADRSGSGRNSLKSVRNRTTGMRGYGSWKAVRHIATEMDALAAFSVYGRRGLPA